MFNIEQAKSFFTWWPFDYITSRVDNEVEEKNAEYYNEFVNEEDPCNSWERSLQIFNFDQVKRFFLQWEMDYRNGDCISEEEAGEKTAEEVAEENARNFEEFLKQDNPL